MKTSLLRKIGLCCLVIVLVTMGWGQINAYAKTALEKAMVDGMLAVFPDASTKNLVESKAGRNWAEAK